MPSADTTLKGPPATGSAPQRRHRLFLVALFLCWLLIYVPGLSRRALLDDADSVHAEAAKEMLLRGDWVTLYADGIRYLEKAPLMYWGIALSFKLFGVTEWTARLPLVLGVLALLLATYSLGRRVFGERGGFYSALILATSFGPFIFTRFLIPDLLVGQWLLLGLDFFLRTLEEERPSRAACWGFAAASALNVLTKGLIGIVFPVGIAGLYLILTGNVRHLRKMRVLSSTLVLLAIAAPWHVLAALRNPSQGPVKGFLWFYFVNEHFLRYLNKRVPHDYDTVPLALFLGLVLVWLLPWSAFLAQGLGQVPRRWREIRGNLDVRGRANLLFALWAGFILLFFSFSTRQEYYLLPALPALALLIGGWLGREAEDESGKLRLSGRWSATALFGVGLGVFVATTVLLAASRPAPPGVGIAELLSKNPQEYALSFGHIFDLTPQALGAFRAPLLGTGIAFLLGTGLCWWFRRRGSPAKANFALAAMMVAFLGCAHQGLVIFEPVLSSKQLALAVERQYRPGEVIIINGDYEDGSTLNFYTGIPVRMLNHREANLWYGSYFPDAPRVFEDDVSFTLLWKSATRVYLFTAEDETPRMLRNGSMPVYEVARSGGKLILSNRPLGSGGGGVGGRD